MKNVTVYRKYDLLVPKGDLGDWDVFDYWEEPRFDSMKAHLNPGDLLFDVGTETGWLSALYAKYIGTKMVLFEPTEVFWPTIKVIWESNGLPLPEAHFVGLVGRETVKPSKIEHGHWTDYANGPILRKGKAYKYLHDNDSTPRVSIDDFMEATDHAYVPKGITIDVEGAEMEVLAGGVKTLDKYKPHVWVSIHPDLMEKFYPDSTPKDLQLVMGGLGYKAKHLATDHEVHMYFSP